MFARVTTFQNQPGRLDDGVRIFRDDVLPWVREATGFRGSLILLDRESARTVAISFWATADAAGDEAASGSNMRERVAAAVEADIEGAAIYEVAVVESLAVDDDG